MSLYDNILVIDDDTTFRESLINALLKAKYSAEGAEDGFEAIEMSRTKAYDLIVSDVRLPKNMDGIETVEKIKDMHKNQDASVIIVTGYADDDTPIRALKVGYEKYLYKPFDLDLFLNQVDTILTKKN